MTYIDLIRPIGDAFYRSLFICGIPIVLVLFVWLIIEELKDDF